jgi:hypothetical protein
VNVFNCLKAGKMSKLQFKKITLDDKEMLEKAFSISHPHISEYTFTNLFVWGSSREIEYANHGDNLVILAHHHGESYFLPPIGSGDMCATFDTILEHAQATGIRYLRRICEMHLEKLLGYGLKIEEDRNSFDYVYKTDDLALLKGRKYSNKRAFVRKFEGEYNHRYIEYDPSWKDECIRLSELWLSRRNISDQTVYDEFDAIKKFLDNYQDLSAIGNLITVDNTLVSFIFGEQLNKRMFVIHFEKADQEYIGSYQAINKMFVDNELLGKYRYVNREQDLGIEGIRKAKKSYLPIKMVKKYNVELQ